MDYSIISKRNNKKMKHIYFYGKDEVEEPMIEGTKKNDALTTSIKKAHKKILEHLVIFEVKTTVK